MYGRSRANKNCCSQKSITFQNEIITRYGTLIRRAISLTCENFRKLHFMQPILCGLVKILCYQYYSSPLSWNLVEGQVNSETLISYFMSILPYKMNLIKIKELNVIFKLNLFDLCSIKVLPW